MKLAIYAIAKNEAENADRFMDSIERAGLRLGGLPVYALVHSTDGTDKILRKRGAHVDTTPMPNFEFDKGKNAALDLVPSDVQFVINVDLDERLDPRFFDIISQLRPDTTALHHLYRPDGEIDRVRHECRVHARHAYRWKFPIHECLEYIGQRGIQFDYSKKPGERLRFSKDEEKIQVVSEVLMTQWPCKTRRHTWCDRLLKAVEKFPNEPRMRMLCGRDLYFESRFHEALEQFNEYIILKKKNIELPPFDLSYVYTMCAKCHKKLGNKNIEMDALREACNAYSRRESHVELAHACMVRGLYKECLDAANAALRVKEGEFSAHYDPGAWSFKPYELIMIALYNLGEYEASEIPGEIALSLAKGDDKKRIQANLDAIRAPIPEAELVAFAKKQSQKV